MKATRSFFISLLAIFSIIRGHSLRFPDKTKTLISSISPMKSQSKKQVFDMASMTIIGLTGGIASGKSTVRGLLKDQGAYVIDADKLGHKSYEPGQKAHKKIVEIFGDEILEPDNTINRKVLGGIVFSNKAEMKKLENAVWPCIREMILQQIDDIRKTSQGQVVVVVEAAVLLEAGWDDMMDQVWAVAVDPLIARDRLMARNNLSQEEADKRIASQMTNEQRVQRAHVVIWNKGSIESLAAEVLGAWDNLVHSLSLEEKPCSNSSPWLKQTKAMNVLMISSAVLIGAICLHFARKM